MSIRYLIKTAFLAIKTNKSRSGLTILGIVIGITAIILIMSIGQGAESLILGQISGMGAETIVIRPGREPKGPTELGETLFSDSLKSRDIEALKKKENVPGLRDIAPAVVVPGSVSYKRETYKATIWGWSAEFMGEIMGIYPEKGKFFTETDIRQKAKVALIGQKVKEELFGNGEAIGKNIKIRGKNFRVIGVFSKGGRSSFFDIDEIVLLPYTTAQSYLLGIDYFHEVTVRAKSYKEVPRVVADIKATLREMHNITNPEKDDFFVVTHDDMINRIKSVMGALTAFLTSVVAISLVVGGIGIMNIMLVSVTERTREIGLRKALGATNSDILIQFLIEAVVLTLFGGLIGILLGFILSFASSIVLSKILAAEWSFSFPISAVFLGLGVSGFVGLLFGLYPARAASKKNPIEALRYE